MLFWNGIAGDDDGAVLLGNVIQGFHGVAVLLGNGIEGFLGAAVLLGNGIEGFHCGAVVLGNAIQGFHGGAVLSGNAIEGFHDAVSMVQRCFCGMSLHVVKDIVMVGCRSLWVADGAAVIVRECHCWFPWCGVVIGEYW